MAQPLRMEDAPTVTVTSVFEHQNTPDALVIARAFRRRYALARRWRLLRVGVGVLIGTVGVLVALLVPDTSDYVSAAAAAWIVFSRTVLAANEQRHRQHGATAHELFDTQVFHLPWSPSIAGDQPAPEDVRNWGRGQSEDGLRDWYSDARPARHPVDVLLCQRSTITWARQDHATYAQLLRWIVGLGLVGTVILGVALDLSLGEYLLRLGLPVLPAALDVLDIAKTNTEVAAAKTRLETEADALLSRARTTATPPTVAECRDLQNGIYATRLRPGVPNYVYRATRARRQENMDETVQMQVLSLPTSLR